MKTVLALLLATVVGLPAAATQTSAYDLIYDPADGSLTMVTTGSIISFVLESSTQPGPVIAENYVPFVAIQEVAPGFFFKTGIVDVGSFYIADIMNFNATVSGYEITPGTYHMGNVLPPSMSEDAFFNLFDKHSSYVVGLGIQKQNFDLIYVPEPSSLALISLAGLALVRRRRDV